MPSPSFTLLENSPLWEREKKAVHKGHAVLLAGEAGTGKRTLALMAACALLSPCGGCLHCPACARVQKGHPDLYWLEKQKDKSLPVAEVRELCAAAGLTSYEGGKKVFVLCNFHLATPAAQNALLKTLEEPPAGAVFFLLCERTESVLPTVLSRVRRVNLPGFSSEALRQELCSRGVSETLALQAAKGAGGSLSLALELAGEQGLLAAARQVLTENTAAGIYLCLQEQKAHLPELLAQLCRLLGEELRANPNKSNFLRQQASLEAGDHLLHNGNQNLVCDRLALRLAEQK